MLAFLQCLEAPQSKTAVYIGLHPPNSSNQNQKHEKDKAPMQASTTTHHGKQIKNLFHGEEWEQAANILLHLLVSDSLTWPINYMYIHMQKTKFC